MDTWSVLAERRELEDWQTGLYQTANQRWLFCMRSPVNRGKWGKYFGGGEMKNTIRVPTENIFSIFYPPWGK